MSITSNDRVNLIRYRLMFTEMKEFIAEIELHIQASIL